MQPDVFEQDQNAYDFLNEGPRKTNQAPGSRKKRLMVAGLAGLGLIIIIWMVFSLIFSGSERATELLVRVAQRQTEIIRISDIGESNARSETAAALAANTKLTLQSSQLNIDRILSSRERTLSRDEQRALEDQDIDAELETALRAGNFDRVFVSILREHLELYQQELDDAHEALNSENDKQILEDAYQSTVILLR